MRLVRPAKDPAETLLRRTRSRLATVTLLVVTALVVAVGVTTALTAITLMRQSIDRTLDAAVRDSLTLHELFEEESEHLYAGPLGDADTFVLLLTADGQILGSTTTAELSGLPDIAALQAASTGEDRRSGTYGGIDVRLLTTQITDVVVEDEEGTVTDGPIYAQAGFNLALQTRLERQMMLGIAIVGLLGIVGAVVVTLFITHRALVPIRDAFATERRFVAAASHELQTPTSIIRASAEILEREHLISGDATTLIGDIIGETDRMGRLVADLLALSSAEAGALHLDVEEVDLGSWFEDVARRARSITEHRGRRFRAEAASTASPLTMQSDRHRLDQIVLILVDNAVNHSPPDGEVALDLSVDVRAGTATAAVRDQGPGIAQQDLERIFEPFARGQGRRSGSGTGLGLAIARQLAGRLGAELTVASPPGSGAIFRLSLPLARADMRRTATASG